MCDLWRTWDFSFLKLCQMFAIRTHCTWLGLFSILVEGREDKDSIFLWLGPLSYCGLYLYQRGHPGYFLFCFHSPVISQCLFLFLPVVTKTKTQNQHLEIWLLIQSSKWRLESSSGVPCTLHPHTHRHHKSTHFCLILLSLLLFETNLGSLNILPSFLLLSARRCSDGVLGITLILWSSCGDRHRGWKSFYNLSQTPDLRGVCDYSQVCWLIFFTQHWS